MEEIKVGQVRKDEEEGFKYKIIEKVNTCWIVELLDPWDDYEKGETLEWHGNWIKEDKVVEQQENPLIQEILDNLSIETAKDYRTGVHSILLKYKEVTISEDTFETGEQ